MTDLPIDPFTHEETRAIVRSWARQEKRAIAAELARLYQRQAEITARMREIRDAHPYAGLVVPGDE